MSTLLDVLLEHPVPVAAVILAAFFYAWHRWVLLPAEQGAAEIVPFPKETRRLTGLGEVLTDEQHAEITRLMRSVRDGKDVA